MEPPENETTLPPYVDPALLDAEQRVAADVPCESCGYNLRTLPALGHCPECNAPAARALTPPQLRFAPAGYLRSLADGVSILFGAGVLLIVVILLELAALLAAIWLADTGEDLMFALSGCGMAVLLIGFPILSIVGLLSITRSDPRPHHRSAQGSSRLASRYVLLVAILGGVLTIASGALVRMAGPASFMLMGCPALVSAALTVIVLPAMTLFYIANLMKRLPDATLEQDTGTLAVGHILVTVIGAALLLFVGLLSEAGLGDDAGVALACVTTGIALAYIFCVARTLVRVSRALRTASVAARSIGLPAQNTE